MTEDKGKPEAPVRIVPSEARPPTKNGGSPPAVAAVRMEALVLWVIQRVEKFPRSHKFTVGDRWIDTCLEVQTSLVEATYVRDKRGLLAGASRGLARRRPRGRGLLRGDLVARGGSPWTLPVLGGGRTDSLTDRMKRIKLGSDEWDGPEVLQWPCQEACQFGRGTSVHCRLPPIVKVHR